MICYHHNDMDGKSAGFLVHYMKPKEIIDTPYSYVQMTYDDIFDKHNANDDVFIVDLSFTENTYFKLLQICKTARTVTWIDHHDSSVEVSKNHKDELQSIKNLTYFVSKAACGAALTYAYFKADARELLKIRQINDDEEYNIDARYSYNGDRASVDLIGFKRNKKDPTDSTYYENYVNLPRWLFYVDDFDCWKKIDDCTEFFKFGVEALNTSISIYDKRSETRVFNNFWLNLVSNVITGDLIRSGENISKYVHSTNYRQISNTFEWEFEGTKFLCKNDCNLGSTIFEHLFDNYDACIAFRYNGKIGKWNYSVYSTEKSKFNCKDFCEKFGGGGHQHAAGFSTDKLLFTHYTEIETEPIIFLGGTCNGDDWRSEFIKEWNDFVKYAEYIPEYKDIELFNPVVEDWTKECEKKENEVKSKAKINLFVITPNMKGFYSIAEAVECSNHCTGKTVFAVCNKYNDPKFDDSIMRSFDAIGKIIENNGGIYISTNGENSIKNIVEAITHFI